MNDYIKERVRYLAFGNFSRAVEYLGDISPQIDDKTAFADMGDSLDIIDFVLAVEKEFGIEIDEKIANAWTAVGQVEDYLIQNINQTNLAQKPEEN